MDNFLIQELHAEQFLITNTDEYYTWYLPAASRGRMTFTARGVEYRVGDAVTTLSTILASPAILGLTITGYLIPVEEHNHSVRLPLFVTDTLYDMRDPFSTEDPQEEPGRVVDMNSFMREYYEQYPDLVIVLMQDLIGISMAEWYNRIDAIWAKRVKLNYPVIGLVFWSRNRDEAFWWRDVPTIPTIGGDRVSVADLSFSVSLPLSEPTIGPYALTWDDLSGNGLALIEWARDTLVIDQVRRLQTQGQVTVSMPNANLARRQHVADITGAIVTVGEGFSPEVNDVTTNNYIAEIMTLAPRQIAYLDGSL